MQSGLLSATSQLENLIGTSFVREDRVDYFGCVKNLGNSSEPHYLLNLTNSILDIKETVKVFVTSDGLPMTTVVGSSANVTAVDSANFEVNYKNGRLDVYLTSDLYGYSHKRRSIAVRYTSGFVQTPADVPFGIATPAQVPAALKDAAMTMAIRAMRASTAPKPKVNTLESRKELSAIARSLIASFIRTRMMGDNPQGTEIK